MSLKYYRLMPGRYCTAICLFAATLVAPVTACADANIESLLSEAGLEFNMPANFASVAVKPNSVFPYEYAIATRDESLQVRYAIRPLGRIDIQYSDAHSNAPHPNDLFKMLFDQITLELAGTRESYINNYAPDQVIGKFNAQWAAAALIDVDPRFAADFNEALIIAIHRDDLADAYLICLFNDYAALRPEITAIESSLRFLPVPDKKPAG